MQSLQNELTPAKDDERGWRDLKNELTRKTLVPHHNADGTLRHYCTADFCPDLHT